MVEVGSCRRGASYSGMSAPLRIVRTRSIRVFLVLGPWLSVRKLSGNECGLKEDEGGSGEGRYIQAQVSVNLEAVADRRGQLLGLTRFYAIPYFL